jgi:hypothetical protein
MGLAIYPVIKFPKNTATTKDPAPSHNRDLTASAYTLPASFGVHQRSVYVNGVPHAKSTKYSAFSQ